MIVKILIGNNLKNDTNNI